MIALMMKQKTNSFEYLLSKGIIDMLLAKGLITAKEHEQIDALNQA